MQAETARHDPLRRFTPTPLVADLRVMGRTVRLETNSSVVLNQTRRLFACYGAPLSGHPEFLWRVVSESAAGLKPPWPDMTAFSAEGLRFVNFGQRSFLAFDLEGREAVGFLAEELAKDETGFTNPFLTGLFLMTAATLGLTSITAACVALGDKGLLIFGPPQSGKTTSSYLAGKLGLATHADHVTFLESEGGSLRAWGDFWPAVFREETQQFLPELQALARRFHYRDLTLLYLEKSRSQNGQARSVSPAFCVFLERQAANVPRLIPLPCGEFARRLKESVPFKDDERFEPQRAAICRALGNLPAYRLAYGSDPATAAIFFRSLLGAHNLLEAQA